MRSAHGIIFGQTGHERKRPKCYLHSITALRIFESDQRASPTRRDVISFPALGFSEIFGLCKASNVPGSVARGLL